MWANVGVAATPRSRMAVVVVDSILFELKDAVDCGRWEEGGTKTTLSGKTKLEQLKGMGKTYWYNRTEFKLFYV